MGDIENANEIIDDLKDQVHDLEHDLRTSEKECGRLEAEIETTIEDQELAEAEHKRSLKALEDAEDTRHEKIMRLEKQIADFTQHAEISNHNYIKALSIAETVRTNGNTDYFRTKDGRKLLDWAVSELKHEAHTIMEG